MENGLKILFVSAEVSPFAKTGGLADVAGSLPPALARSGNDIRIAMPAYKIINAPMEYRTDFAVSMNNRSETCIIKEGKLPYNNKSQVKSIPVYFLNSYTYYDREGIYCYFDDADRFAFFCKAVLEMLPIIDFKPDIIHCNDWHTGPVSMLLKEEYSSKSFYENIATVFTIHNMQYQGNFHGSAAGLFNVNTNIMIHEKAEFYGAFSFMKCGIVYSNKINTVSKVYAKEIQTPQYGENMDGLMRNRAQDLFGILNGISYEEFNPQTDTRIYKNYSLETIEGKYENKHSLQKEMGLPVSDAPLFGLISRLSGQKGLDLIMERIDEFMEENVQFVLLGTGDGYYENAFRDIAAKYPDKAAVNIGFDAVLAQKIYAGSDLFLMPSRYEPCGLGQIISFSYGTIPVVRATGGLAETVVDYNRDSLNGNGFSFKEFESSQFIDAISRAINIYYNKTDEWKELVIRAMKLNFSWDRSAKEYMSMYRLAMQS